MGWDGIRWDLTGISLGPRIFLFFGNRGYSWDLKDEAGTSKDYIGYHNPIRTYSI
jgi:hypothetical protein